MLASTPGSFFFVDEKSIKWSKNSSGTDVVNCVIEQRNEETQKILKEIPQTFNVVYGKNAQIEKITLRDILI
jgi:Zn-finger protein